MKIDDPLFQKIEEKFHASKNLAWETYKTEYVNKMVDNLPSEEIKETILEILQNVFFAGFSSGHLESSMSIYEQFIGNNLTDVIQKIKKMGYKASANSVDDNTSQKDFSKNDSYELNESNVFIIK